MPSSSTTTTPSIAYSTDASGTSPAQLLHAVKVAILDAIAGGLSFSTILHFIHTNFAQTTPDPIVMTIDDWPSIWPSRQLSYSADWLPGSSKTERKSRLMVNHILLTFAALKLIQRDKTEIATVATKNQGTAAKKYVTWSGMDLAQLHAEVQTDFDNLDVSKLSAQPALDRQSPAAVDPFPHVHCFMQDLAHFTLFCGSWSNQLGCWQRSKSSQVFSKESTSSSHWWLILLSFDTDNCLLQPIGNFDIQTYHDFPVDCRPFQLIVVSIWLNFTLQKKEATCCAPSLHIHSFYLSICITFACLCLLATLLFAHFPQLWAILLLPILNFRTLSRCTLLCISFETFIHLTFPFSTWLSLAPATLIDAWDGAIQGAGRKIVFSSSKAITMKRLTNLLQRPRLTNRLLGFQLVPDSRFVSPPKEISVSNK